MKSKSTFLVMLIIGLMSSSCTHYIYDVKTLQANYDARMTTAEELQIKSQVKIFTSEQDIKGDYELLSFNSYAPFRFLPFAKPYVKRSSKTFYKKAVQVAYDEGGNAIIIVAPLYYKVIRLADFNEETAKVEEWKSTVFDTKAMRLVETGAVATMTRGERRKTLDAFEKEIETDVANLNYLPEVQMVREKMMAYSTYNKAQKHPKHSIEKFIKKQSKKANSREKKIKKMIAKNKVDSVFLEHTAVCEKQLADFYVGSSEVAPLNNEPAPQPVEAPRPAEQTKSAKQAKSAEPTKPAEEAKPAEQKPRELVFAEDIDKLEYSAELLNAVKNGKYCAALDLDKDGVNQPQELELVETLANQSDMDGNRVWDESELRSFRHRLSQAVRYYKK